jgi:predicted amidohydrolase YtcJ
MWRSVSRIDRFAIACAVAGLSASSCHGGRSKTAKAAPPAPADVVLRGGHVWTSDATRPTAVAVAGGKIVAVGNDTAVSAYVGASTRVVELAGRAVVASLTDAHGHLEGLGRALDQVDLRGCDSEAACAERIARAASGIAATEWVFARGWDQNRFHGQQFPTHAALDKIKQPVWARRVDGHAGWANARALALGKVTRKTPDPPGGRIMRDRRGQPTGVFIDAAQDLIEGVIPAPPPAAIERAILRGQDAALADGLTSVHDMGVSPAEAGVYRALEAAGKLKMRVYAMASGGEAELTQLMQRPPAAPGPMFTLAGIKLYADGALGSRGAALLTPYSDDPKNSGLELMPEAAIQRLAGLALEHGWQVAVHAIGDRANRQVLDAFEHAGCKAGRDVRFRVEHAQVLAPEDIPRFARLGVIASMQPVHATSDMPWAGERLGEARLAGAYAWHSLIDAGARLAFGSDFPVESPSALAGLYAAATRTDKGGLPHGGWLPKQRLTLEQALAAFTSGAAYAAFEEKSRGRAAVGQAADLTVFDQELDVAHLLETHVALTMVGGQVVFEKH